MFFLPGGIGDFFSAQYCIQTTLRGRFSPVLSRLSFFPLKFCPCQTKPYFPEIRNKHFAVGVLRTDLLPLPPPPPFPPPPPPKCSSLFSNVNRGMQFSLRSETSRSLFCPQNSFTPCGHPPLPLPALLFRPSILFCFWRLVRISGGYFADNPLLPTPVSPIRTVLFSSILSMKGSPLGIVLSATLVLLFLGVFPTLANSAVRKCPRHYFFFFFGPLQLERHVSPPCPTSPH